MEYSVLPVLGVLVLAHLSSGSAEPLSPQPAKRCPFLYYGSMLLTWVILILMEINIILRDDVTASGRLSLPVYLIVITALAAILGFGWYELKKQKNVFSNVERKLSKGLLSIGIVAFCTTLIANLLF